VLGDFVDLKAKGLRITWFAGNGLQLTGFSNYPADFRIQFFRDLPPPLQGFYKKAKA
jgi:hypothetical protein